MRTVNKGECMADILLKKTKMTPDWEYAKR